MRRAVVLLMAVGLAAFGWVLPWPDPAQAGAALQWVGWVMLSLALMHRADRPARLCAAVSAGVGVAGAACASMFDLLSQVRGSCDEGTGRPVTGAIAAVVLAVAAELWVTMTRTDSHDQSTPG